MIYDERHGIDQRLDNDCKTQKEKRHKIVMKKYLCILLIIIFTSCNMLKKTNLVTYDKGVVINGVCWATRNVDKPDTFTTNPENAGMFYVWNRKTAWNITDSILASKEGSAYPKGTEWEKANDPSPKGWCVPTLDEFKTLLDTNKVNNEWITRNGVNGRKFTDKATGNSLFLPAVGARGYDGRLYDSGLEGEYWSCTVEVPYGGYGLEFNRDTIELYYGSHTGGFSVRSVKEK